MYRVNVCIRARVCLCVCLLIAMHSLGGVCVCGVGGGRGFIFWKP